MTSAPKVTVRIGSLVLHGAAPGQGAPLAAALKAELGRLLAAPGGIPPALISGAAPRARIDGGTFAPATARAGAAGGTDRQGAVANGTAIARSIYRSLAGGTRR